MYAIKPHGIGKPVSARGIEPDWPLEDGEIFTVEDYHSEMVLAEDEASLREPTQSELDAMEPSTAYTPYEFWQRFTKTERKNIRNAAKQNDDLEDWLDMLRVTSSVVVDDPNTVAGMQALVDAGLLTAARRDEILGNA